MKKESVKKCNCEACAGFKKLIAQEISLHAFIGNCPPNIKSDIGEFQESLEFTNALHWDVGYCGDARYYIYRDNEGNLLAWYDRVKKAGFKPDYFSHALTNEFFEAL
jgi:hypothetical protein